MENHFDAQFVCVPQSDHTYHQKNIGGSTCTLYPLSLLPLQPGITKIEHFKAELIKEHLLLALCFLPLMELALSIEAHLQDQKLPR